MMAVLSWLRNNIVSVVEVFSILIKIVALVVNIVARLGLPTKGVQAVHDFMKNLEKPIDKIKDFLLQRVG